MELTRTDQIRGYVNETFHQHGIEDTAENRLHFLEIMRESWKEDKAVNFEETLERSLYMIALNGEIMIEKMKIGFSRIK